jgi:hypothetical protein
MASFTIHIVASVAPSVAWPQQRPIGYDPDASWDEESGTWTSVLVGGGKYSSQLVLVGSDDVGQGVIYYAEI